MSTQENNKPVGYSRTVSERVLQFSPRDLKKTFPVVRYHVSEGTLQCLSALPLRVREDERARAKARVKSKNRKRRREGSVEAGLMEADARVDDDVRAKCQADALHEVCRTTFFIFSRAATMPRVFFFESKAKLVIFPFVALVYFLSSGCERVACVCAVG